MAKKPIDPRIDEALKKCNPQKTIYALAEFVDSFQAGITNAQSTADQAIKNAESVTSIAEVAQKAAEEAAQNVGEAFDTVRASPNSSAILMEYIRINGNEQKVALPVVNTTNAGILNANDYKFFQEYDARLRAVEGISKIYLVELPSDNPSQQQITLAYTSRWPDAPNPPLEGTVVVDPARNNLSYRWNTQSNTWYEIFEVAIQQFTNTTLGTIKGSTQDGEVQANADGTGSVTGWDTIKGNISTAENNINALTTRVNNAESSITSLTTQIDANTEGIAYTRARVINRMHAAGNSTGGVLLTVFNPDDFLLSDTIIPVVNSATSGVVTPDMYRQWNSGGNGGSIISTATTDFTTNLELVTPEEWEFTLRIDANKNIVLTAKLNMSLLVHYSTQTGGNASENNTKLAASSSYLHLGTISNQLLTYTYSDIKVISLTNSKVRHIGIVSQGGSNTTVRVLNLV